MSNFQNAEVLVREGIPSGVSATAPVTYPIGATSADDKAGDKAGDNKIDKANEPAISVQGNLSPEDQAAVEKRKQEMIVKENERRQKEYDDKVKAGQQRVKELNDRFADWYFIISDDVYKKIHLGRGDVVKQKEKKEEADGAAKEPAAPEAEPKAE